MKGTALDQTIDYGVQLNFLESDEDVLSATRRGQQLGYGNLPSDRENGLFRDAIQELPIYSEYLDLAVDEIREINDAPAIERDGLTRELRIEFGYDVSDRILESVANTFLKTLDAAGLGEHKTGRKGYPTRFVIGEDFDDFTDDSKRDNPEVSQDSSEENEASGTGDSESNDVSPNGSQGGPDDSIGGKNSLDIDDIVELASGENSGIELSININISSEDWGSDDVIDFVNSINEVKQD